jgi:hypothetical protein
MKPLQLFVLTLPLCLLAACESMPSASDARPDASAKSEGEGEKGKDDKESPAEELAKKERGLENARLELAIAQADVEASGRKAQDEVADCEHRLKLRQEALEHFLKQERELELAKVQLGVDQAAWRLEAEKQELAELEAMYKKDDVATLTKELVLQRGKKGVEFAERGLDHERREAAAKRDYELPKKQKELEQEQREAEHKLREARAEKEKAGVESELKLRKARAEVEDAEKALVKARAKAEGAKAEGAKS